MIYTNFVEFHSQMLHTKFQNHRPSGSLKVFAIYSHGGHLGHVTLTIYTNFHSLLLRMLHIKFGFDFFVLFSCYSHQSISDYSWEVYIVHSGVFAG